MKETKEALVLMLITCFVLFFSNRLSLCSVPFLPFPRYTCK